MREYDKLLLANKAWAEERKEANPEFFTNMAKFQKPKFLWIGCSDSRVPANEITNTEPGEVFVHRNVANMVVHTDLNMLSVLQYAVEVLKVEHVMVVGHYGCGGVHASLRQDNLGIINKWLRNIKEVYRQHREELESIPDMVERGDKLVEHNIVEQVHNLVKTSIIQKAWNINHQVTVHGWVFDMKDGMLHELIRLDHTHQVDPIFKFNFED